ncbi:YidC/Oxa1 family membrane protein insertase [Candidatus Weimeria sp. HCP3S3_B5]|uniref:YidC/Oxa1 family membrane protein insertase n=1 Tax=Candidatus Weimeria sp. HCP3S3_B5 TaxID=3438871 RepID=UPI003F886256
MIPVFLTAYNGTFIGPIAKGLGWIMDKIYYLIYTVLGIHNGSIAFAIVLFTFIIYMALLPLTYKQQKFSMLQRKMQPELSAIQKKYKGKRDQASMQAMNEETQDLYAKYGVSPMGSCIQLLIQMPILFALYRVFYNIPAYLGEVKGIFSGLTNSIVSTSGYEKIMTALAKTAGVANTSFNGSGTASKNFVIDVLYKLPDSGWMKLTDKFPDLSSQIRDTHGILHSVNYLGNLNISDTPWRLISYGFSNHLIGLAIGAILIPILAYGTQYLNMRLTPQSNDSNDQMARQMRTMNLMMPLMTLFISFTTPVGLSIYWIAGAVIRSIQQVLLNRHFENIDLNDIIERNKEKAQKKREKRGIARDKMMQYSNMSTRSLSSKANSLNDKERVDQLEKARETASHARKGSMASKANLVRDFNQRNTKSNHKGGN